MQRIVKLFTATEAPSKYETNPGKNIIRNTIPIDLVGNEVV